MDNEPLESPDIDNQLDNDHEMNEHDSIVDNMPAHPESDETEQEGIDNLVNKFEDLNVSENSDSNRESLTCQAATVEFLPVGQTVDSDNTDHVQIPQESSKNSESKQTHCELKTEDDIVCNSRIIVDVKNKETENDDSTKIPYANPIPDIRSCGCRRPCVFSPPGLPEIETESPTQLLKIMTLLPCWKRDNKFITDLLLFSQRDLSVPIPCEQFFRAVARCSNIREFIKDVPGWTEAFFQVTDKILKDRNDMVHVFEKKSTSTFRNLDIETEVDSSDGKQMDETIDAVDDKDSIKGVLTEMDNHNHADIRVLLQNVRGCRELDKMQNLCSKFISSKYNILVVTESHLSPDVSSSSFNSFGVSILRCDRNSAYNEDKIKLGRSGGVAILYKPGICITEIPIKFNQHYGGHRCEILACRISLPSGKFDPFTLFAVYRPPDTGTDEVIKLIKHLELFLPDSRCKLVGDFNFNEEKPKSGALEFFEFIKNRKMTQTVEEDTRIVRSKPDLVFYSSDLKKEKADVFEPFVFSDHNSISFLFSLTPISTVPSPNILSSSLFIPKSNSNLIQLDHSKLSASCCLTERRHSFSSNTIPNKAPLRRAKSCFDVSTLVDDVLTVNWQEVFPKDSSSLQKYEAFFEKMSTIVQKYKAFFEKMSPIVRRYKNLTPQTRTTEKMKVRNVHAGAILGITKIFTHDTVQRTLEALPKSSDPSLFLLNNEILRQCATPLAKPLAFIFKELLRKTAVPYLWKKSVGVEFNAEKNPEQNIQYESEPIANVMEKILCNYLMKSNDYLFSPMGNEEGHPNETWYTAKGKKLAVVEFSIHEPLQKISIQQLINNAEKFGIHPIFSKWFDKLLSHRSFFVKGSEHDYPLLFTTSFKSFSADLFAHIYINPLLLGFPPQVSCSFCSFTGEIKFWSHSKKNIQTCINYIETWCQNNGLDCFELIPTHRGPSTISMTFKIKNKPVEIKGKTRPKTPSKKK